MHSLHCEGQYTFRYISSGPLDKVQKYYCMFGLLSLLIPKMESPPVSGLPESSLCLPHHFWGSHSMCSEFQKGWLLDWGAPKVCEKEEFAHMPWLSHWLSRHLPRSWFSWTSQTSAVSWMWPKRSWTVMAVWTSSSTMPAWRWRGLPIRYLWSSTKRSWTPITLGPSH